MRQTLCGTPEYIPPGAWCGAVHASRGRRNDLTEIIYPFIALFPNPHAEMVAGRPYDHTIDIWALGIFTYELLQGPSHI